MARAGYPAPRLGAVTAGPWVRRTEARWWQFDLTTTVEQEQQAAAHPLARRAVGLLPVPYFTQPLPQLVAAGLWMRGHQFPNKVDLARVDGTAPIAPLALHETAV